MSEETVPSFEEIAIEYSAALTGYLRKMTGNPADADDLLQDALMRIARGLPHFEGRSSVKTWLYRIAHNVAIDFLRKSKKATIVEFEEADAPSDVDDEDELIVGEMNSCIRGVIDSLPGDYRSALVLHTIEGKPVAEVAEVCDISLSNAKVRIHRAKARLREALGKQCDFYQSDEGTLRCDRK